MITTTEGRMHEMGRMRMKSADEDWEMMIWMKVRSGWGAGAEGQTEANNN